MFSNKVRYALRALIDLGLCNTSERISIREIAARQGIPEHFLQKVLMDLKDAGLVSSRKGPSGGFHLSKRLEEISLFDVVEALESKFPGGGCPSDCECPSQGFCAVEGALTSAEHALELALKQVPICGLVANQRELNDRRGGALDFSI